MIETNAFIMTLENLGVVRLWGKYYFGELCPYTDDRDEILDWLAEGKVLMFNPDYQEDVEVEFKVCNINIEWPAASIVEVTNI